MIIGIDDYNNGWPRLSMAVRDAEQIAAALKERGFEVTLLKNVTGDDLRTALRHFFAIEGADPNARLFVWFAGHGHTEGGEGFIVPVDAPKPGTPEFRFSALHMADLAGLQRLAVSKHALTVFDSCFGGTVFSTQRSRPPQAITHAVTKPVRQFLTSGDADQTVSDDGTFRTLFLRAIDGEEGADINGDGFVTASELGFHMSDRMINLTRSAQTPRSGKLRDARYDRGDFVFQVKQAALSKPAAAGADKPAEVGAAALEVEFWNAIKESGDPASYQAYLETYPNGTFSPLARLRVTKLAKPEVMPSRSAGDGQVAARTPAEEPTSAAPDDSRLLSDWRQRSDVIRKAISRKLPELHGGNWQIERFEVVGATPRSDNLLALDTVYTIVTYWAPLQGEPPRTYRQTVIVDSRNDEVVEVEKARNATEAATQSPPRRTASRTPDASTRTGPARAALNDRQLLEYWRQRSGKVTEYVETLVRKLAKGVKSGNWDIEAIEIVGASTIGDRVRLETEYTVKKVRGRNAASTLPVKYRKYVYVDMQSDSVVGGEKPEKIE